MNNKISCGFFHYFTINKELEIDKEFDSGWSCHLQEVDNKL